MYNCSQIVFKAGATSGMPGGLFPLVWLRTVTTGMPRLFSKSAISCRVTEVPSLSAVCLLPTTEIMNYLYGLVWYKYIV